MVFQKWINLLSGGGFDVCCQKSRDPIYGPCEGCNQIGFYDGGFCRFEPKCRQWSVSPRSSTSLGTRSWLHLHRLSCSIPSMLANVWWNSRTTLIPNRWILCFWTEPCILMTSLQIRDVVGNNPDIFLMNWSDLQKTMEFLESTMNVSARRVSITPSSLTHALTFYQTRYQVIYFNDIHITTKYEHLWTRSSSYVVANIGILTLGQKPK